jgi:hypothetical protein
MDLNYNTMDLGYQFSQKIREVREKIFKEIDLGRVAGPFDYPPMPTFRVSPIFLVRKKNGDFRLIHNLSYPTISQPRAHK